MSRRPTRPLPSRKGWMVSNWACASPTWIRGGRPAPSCRNLSRSDRAPGTSCGGGGTKVALARVQPPGPIQFWLVRNSPGVTRPPRTPCQYGVNLANQAYGAGQVSQPRLSMVHGAHVVGLLVHVPGGIGVEQLRLGSQQILQGALRALDLAGEHGLLADIHEYEQVGIGQREHGAVQPSQGVVGLRQALAQRAGEIQWRIRRQGRGDEGPVAGGLLQVTAGPVCSS